MASTPCVHLIFRPRCVCTRSERGWSRWLGRMCVRRTIKQRDIVRRLLKTLSVSSSRVPKSLCWWTVAIPDLSWTYRTHTSVPLNRIFKHQLHVIQNSHDFWMYRLQTSADISWRTRCEQNRCNDLRFSGYHRARAQGPGKCLPSDYVYADFAEGTPYVPDTSAEYELPA
jgi:hypothetical protein